MDENISENDPVRIISKLIDGLDLSGFYKLYKSSGRSPYHPRMMLKVIIYAYMNNVYSCRRIEKRLLRDIQFMWLSGGGRPDFITVNRFRNRMKKGNKRAVHPSVLVPASKGFLSLEVEYTDGTKIESKVNRYILYGVRTRRRTATSSWTRSVPDRSRWMKPWCRTMRRLTCRWSSHPKALQR